MIILSGTIQIQAYARRPSPEFVDTGSGVLNVPVFSFSSNGRDVVLDRNISPEGVWVFNLRGRLSLLPGRRFFGWMEKGRKMLVGKPVHGEEFYRKNFYQIGRAHV